MRYHAAMSVSALTPSPNSTRPYLLRALYEWCTDNGYTPYIAAYVDETVQVPREHVKNNEIVLNISMDATSSLKLGNEFVQFKARFSGTAREIMVPIDRVIAIYARENGQGMAFPIPQSVPPRGEVTEPDTKVPDTKVHLLGKRSFDTSATDATSDDVAHDSAHSGTVGTESVTSKIVQLVSNHPDASADTASSSENPQSDDDLPPTPPHPPAGARPALKRVK